MDEPLTTTTDPSLMDGGHERPALGRGALATAGFAGLALWVCLFVQTPDGPPMASATPQQVRDFVIAQDSAIKGSAIAGMLGVVAGVVFVAALVRQVRDRLPGSLLAEVVLGAGLLVVVYEWLLTTAETLTALLPHLVDAELATVDDATLRGWYGLTGFTHFMGDLALVPMVLLIGAFSLAGRRGGLLPGWLAWTGLVVVGAGVLGMVGILAAVDVLYVFWFAAIFGYFLWIPAVSITFLVRLRRSTKAAAR